MKNEIDIRCYDFYRCRRITKCNYFSLYKGSKYCWEVDEHLKPSGCYSIGGRRVNDKTHSCKECVYYGYAKEIEVLEIIREHVSRQFPRRCMCCRKRYDSLKDYIRKTTHAGKPVCYDAEIEDWQPKNPIGTVALSTCSCGSTIGVGSYGLDLKLLWKLMSWARNEIKTRCINMSDLLDDIRSKIEGKELQGEYKVNFPQKTRCLLSNKNNDH